MPRAGRWELAKGASTSSYSKPHDIEVGPQRMPRTRFRDAVHKVVRDGRREKLKKQLLEGMERFQFENFRKSDDELNEIKEKNRTLKGLRKEQAAHDKALNDARAKQAKARSDVTAAEKKVKKAEKAVEARVRLYLTQFESLAHL